MSGLGEEPSQSRAIENREPDGLAASDRRQCWRCAKKVPAHLESCPYCFALAAPAPAHSPAEPDPDVGRLLRVLGVFGVLLAVSLVLGLALDWGPSLTSDGHVRTLVAAELIDAIVVFASLTLVRVRFSWPSRSGRQRLRAWGVGGLALAGCLLVNMLYHAALRRWLHVPPTDFGVYHEARFAVLGLIVICVQPAIVEEIFFRHIALGAIGAVSGARAAVLVTAVMFAMAHIYVPLSTPVLFLVGIALGYARIASGGLALPMAMHFLHNAAVLSLASWAGR
jgi:uncharacterized protein